MVGRLFIRAIFSVFSFLLVFVILLSGCNNAPTTPAASEEPSESATPGVTYPFVITLSFPDGAPPLNQSKVLKCVVRSNYPVLDMSLEVSLPESLELATGNLSWSGIVPAHGEVTVVNATVKAITTGNWTITVLSYFNADKENIGHSNIYLSISEDSAEWRKRPSYDSPPGISPETSTDLPTPIPTHT